MLRAPCTTVVAFANIATIAAAGAGNDAVAVESIVTIESTALFVNIY